MQYAHTLFASTTACPQCETELDQASGICPACRWDAALASHVTATAPTEDDVSFSERYRGTEYHHLMATINESEEGPGRTRLLLVVGLFGILGLFYFILDSLYII
jgi:hypothetical protein